MTPPLDWRYPLDVVAGGVDETREASAEECQAVASALDILACNRLSVSYTIKALSRGRYRLAGRLKAAVVQACVVSLDPVADQVAEDFEIEFRPPDDIRGGAGREDDLNQDAPILDGRDIEPIAGGMIDAGRVVYETLATGLNPYPRAPGADLEATEAGAAGQPETASPFAVLARIRSKDRPED